MWCIFAIRGRYGSCPPPPGPPPSLPPPLKQRPAPPPPPECPKPGSTEALCHKLTETTSACCCLDQALTQTSVVDPMSSGTTPFQKIFPEHVSEHAFECQTSLSSFALISLECLCIVCFVSVWSVGMFPGPTRSGLENTDALVSDCGGHCLNVQVLLPSASPPCRAFALGV